MPTGLDQSWGFASPSAAKAAGVKVVAMYFSYDSSKNVNASKVKAYHNVGIGYLPNWESQTGAPLNGASQGKADATEAVRQLRALVAAVGYKPSNRLVIYFSCDRDVTSSQYGVIDAYFRAAAAVCHAAGFGVGVYGEANLVAHLSAEGITDAEWQTYAWSGGVLSPATDFYQYDNGQNLGGASVDFDKIIHESSLGAWWAPGSSNDTEGVFTLDAASKAQIQAMLDAQQVELVHRFLDDVNHNPHLVSTYINQVRGDVAHVLATVNAVSAKVDKVQAAVTSVGQVLSTAGTGVLARVATLQTAVAKIVPQPAQIAAVDTAAITEAVFTKVKSLVWKAS